MKILAQECYDCQSQLVRNMPTKASIGSFADMLYCKSNERQENIGKANAVSILDRELKGQHTNHPRLRRTLLIIGGLLFVLLIFFSFTNFSSDVAFVQHALKPPAHFTFHGQNGYISSVAWSPDGQEIASASGDGTVQVWNAHTGTIVRIYKGHTGDVLAVAWSPDGHELATGGLDTTVQVWNVATGQRLFTYRGHSDAVFSVAWSPDSKYIASASQDGTVQVWNATNGQSLLHYGTHPLRGVPPPWNSVAWSPNGRELALGGEGDAIVLNMQTTKEVGEYGYNGGTIHALCWSPDGRYIAFGGSDSTVQVWDLATHQNVYTYQGHQTDVFSVAWSPDGQRIASGSGDGLIEVWDALTGQHVYTYRGHADFYMGHLTSGSNAAVNTLAWSPNGLAIASGSNDNTVQVWKPM